VRFYVPTTTSSQGVVFISGKLSKGHTAMNDQEFISAFEQGTLPHFPHQAHLRMAWIYLRADRWEKGKARIIDGIRHLSVAHGAPQKYHETITVFWARLVKHAIDHAPHITDFHAFADTYPMLFDKKLISKHFSAERLASEQARQGWIEPDLLPLPAFQLDD